MTAEQKPPRVHIAIDIADGFVPSPRLLAALEELDAAAESEFVSIVQRMDAPSGDDEVAGYGLSVGDLGVGRPATTGWWDDGCWGFGDGHCRWYQGDCAQLNTCSVFKRGG